MSEKSNIGSSRQNPLVWILGRKHPGADKSITWLDKLPNLSDPDVLVVDMTTLDSVTLGRIESSKRGVIHTAIRDRLIGKATVVVITARRFWIKGNGGGSPDRLHDLRSHTFTPAHTYSNYHILPVNLRIKNVEIGRVINADRDHSFKMYIDNIKKFSFYLEDSYSFMVTQSSKQLYKPYRLVRTKGQDITDNAGHYLGFTLTAVKPALTGFELEEKRGQLVLLPPPMDGPDDAIERILSACGKVSPSGESPPAWVDSLSFTKADLLQEDISKLVGQISKTRDEINGLERRKRAILDHRRLLYAKGAELEVAVVGAFKALGFSGAERVGGPDSPDCILGMDTSDYRYGLVEVKGADGRTKEQDIAQCIKWIDKAHDKGEKWPKPIFIPNQYRRMDYPSSLKDRLKFEEREIDYAKKRGVCIIPSCVLYEAVKKAIDEGAPDKTQVAEKIAGTDGVLESVF